MANQWKNYDNNVTGGILRFDFRRRLEIDFQRQPEFDFPMSNLVIAAALEGNIGGKENSKMVVIGDGDFPLGGMQRGQVNPDNVSLMVNSIDWLSDDTGLIELRTKGATSRPLDDIEDGKRAFLKYLNFLLPLILIIVYGIVRIQRKQTLRIKRMEEGYV